MLASRALFVTIFIALASSFSALAAPADEARTLVQALNSTSALGFSGSDPNFAGVRRQSCPNGLGVCPDGG